MNHYYGSAAVALVYVVYSQSVELDPSFLEWPSVEVWPALSDHGDSPIAIPEIVWKAKLSRYRTVVTGYEETIISALTEEITGIRIGLGVEQPACSNYQARDGKDCDVGRRPRLFPSSDP